jgi:molecular chaperone DnaJ
MKIPAGSQSGSTFRLRGKGMPVLNHSTHGDQLVKINVAIPTHLTPRQKQLIEEFSKTN